LSFSTSLLAISFTGRGDFVSGGANADMHYQEQVLKSFACFESPRNSYKREVGPAQDIDSAMLILDKSRGLEA
jgi:hypothetical protein